MQGAEACQRDGAAKPSCLVELSNTLFVIFGSQVLVGNFTELLWPLIRLRLMWFKRRCCKRTATSEGTVPGATSGVGMGAPARPRRRSVATGHDGRGAAITLVGPRGETDAELQYAMEEYGAVSLVDDYTEMVLQFGYVTLFVAVLPLAPLLALINNYLEIRIDAYRLCVVHRRPIPQSADGVALWGDILHAMAFFSVAVSGSIVCFKSKHFTSSMGDAGRVWAFVLFEHLVMGIKAIVDLVIADVPPHVQLQKERQDFLVRKVINLEPDDDESGLELGIRQKRAKDAKLLLILDSWQPRKMGKKRRGT